MSKRRYLAQNNARDASGHQAKYCATPEEAREFSKKNGGGTIKKRNAAIVQDPFAGPIRTFGVIEEVKI
jgi:hypothetical protein